MLTILIDTLLDSLRMIPFLFFAYLMIEYIENKASSGLKNILTSCGKFGPLGGAVLGSFPQCGFSVMAANLYSQRLLTKGTLIAVFLATSDEAIPVFLANQGSGSVIFSLIFLKIIIAIIAGFLIDFIDIQCFQHTNVIGVLIKNNLCKTCNCKENIFFAAVKHTLTIFFFILIISFALNTIIYFLGDALFSKILMSNTPFQVVIAGLFGLIPNCASSIILTQLYLAGSISLGSIIAGLSTGAGIGLAVLFRINAGLKENLKILALLYLIGISAGIMVELLGLTL